MLIRLLRKIKNKLYSLPHTAGVPAKHYIVGKNTSASGFQVAVRNAPADKIFVEIGNDSLITGTFVFDAGTGKVTIGNNTFIGGSTFICIEEIIIGNDVMVSWGCTLVDNNSHSLNWEERKNDVRDWKRGVDEGVMGQYKDWTHVQRAGIRIKDKAWISFNSIILKGITIGEGSIVAAGSVVTKDVPDWVVVAGNPAKVVKHLREAVAS